MGVRAAALALAGVCAAAPAQEYAYEARAGGPYEEGLPPDFCRGPTLYGASIDEVGRQFVAVNNALTGSECYGVCNDPVSYLGVSGELFGVRSVCSGSEF